jgi:hypothetical protein
LFKESVRKLEEKHDSKDEFDTAESRKSESHGGVDLTFHRRSIETMETGKGVRGGF